MNKFIYQFGVCNKVIDNICSMIGRGVWPEQISYRELYDELTKLLPEIPEEFKMYKSRLEDRLLPNLKLADVIQTNQYGYESTVQRTGINPYVFGQIVATRCYMRECLENKNSSSFWQNIQTM